MGTQRKRSEHALVKLRKILKKSQRDLLEGFSGAYIGKLERGDAKVSIRLSNAIAEKYGAWVQPGYGTSDVFEAFGEEWDRARKVIYTLSHGRVVETNSFDNCEDIEKVLDEEADDMFGKRTINRVSVVERIPDLNQYSNDSERRFKEYLIESKRYEEEHVRKDGEKLLVVMRALVSSVSLGEDQREVIDELKKAIDGVIKRLELDTKVNLLYHSHLDSIEKLFPSVSTVCNGTHPIKVVAKLQTRGAFKNPGSYSPGVFIDNLPAPESFEYFKDWEHEGMDADTWRNLWERVQNLSSNVS